MMLKQRIAALILALVSAGILYQTWYQARNGEGYFLKAAAFAPLGIIAGLFLTVFPSFSGKPETTRQKIVIASVFIIGVLSGLYNWYLIDPQAFNF